MKETLFQPGYVRFCSLSDLLRTVLLMINIAHLFKNSESMI